MKEMLSEQQLLHRQHNKLTSTWHYLVSETRMTNAVRQDLPEPLKGSSKETHKTNSKSSAGCLDVKSSYFSCRDKCTGLLLLCPEQSWQFTLINHLRPQGKNLEEVR